MNRDEYTRAVIDAIAKVDAADDGYYYVKTFEIAISGVIEERLIWDDDHYRVVAPPMPRRCARCGTIADEDGYCVEPDCPRYGKVRATVQSLLSE